MIAIDARLTLFALIPLPFVSISVKYFGGMIHKRFEQIQAQLVRRQRGGAGSAVRRPRGARVPAGSGGDRAIPARERGVPPAQSSARS